MLFTSKLMLNVKLFIELTRLNKPIGYMLLFWPCIWGLTIAYEFTSELETLFFLYPTFLYWGCVNEIGWLYSK